jgi:hypothetical protein
MMKNFMLLSVLAAAAAGGAFALPELKLGAGGYAAGAFGGGVEGFYRGRTMSIKVPYSGGGGFAFFDAGYAELSLGVLAGGGSYEAVEMGEKDESDMSFTAFDIGLLGKYPIAVTEKLSVFPLLGITYRIMLSVKDKDGNQYKNSDGVEAPGDFSALWFKLGGGLDFSFTDHLYLRGGLLYGLRFANTFEKDMVDLASEADPITLPGHGIEVKIAAGYQF